MPNVKHWTINRLAFVSHKAPVRENEIPRDYDMPFCLKRGGASHFTLKISIGNVIDGNTWIFYLQCSPWTLVRYQEWNQLAPYQILTLTLGASQGDLDFTFPFLSIYIYTMCAFIAVDMFDFKRNAAKWNHFTIGSIVFLRHSVEQFHRINNFNTSD